MKRLICLLFALMILLSSVSSFAESSGLPTNEEVGSALETFLAELEPDYSEVIFNENQMLFVVDIAIDGLAKSVVSIKENGFQNSEEAEWLSTKASFLFIYTSILNEFRQAGRFDLSLSLNLVNDDAYIRNDYSTISYNPFITIHDTLMYDVFTDGYMFIK